MRRLARLVAWFVVINALITIFGVTTAPLLLLLAVDIAIGSLLIRGFLPQRRYADGGP